MPFFHDCYRSRRVLVTGHTGFKGSWLAYLLEQRLGSTVCGISLPPAELSHFNLLKLESESHLMDIRSPELERVFAEFRPEIVFHLAAQAIVRTSYSDPAGTFSTNVSGLVNVLEACRNTPSVRAIVVVTSDKCYENRETFQPYPETAPLGGFDPYSASKACQELAAQSWRRSFFGNGPLLATARAGNVVGGGDWAECRLIPDLVRAAAEGRTAVVRNPDSVRPWQHVLEPLAGYLLLGEKLFEGDSACASAWNFGPDSSGTVTVAQAAETMKAVWPAVKNRVEHNPCEPHEAVLLNLDCSKAREKLQWRPVWNAETAFRRTAEWYKLFYAEHRLATADDADAFFDSVRGQSWITE